MPSLFHPQIANLLGIITLAIWLHLFFGRALFWRVRSLDADRLTPKEPAQWPSVAVVVPARNEAQTIAQVTTNLVLQNYPGQLSITLVDDHSTDATAELARQAASLHSAAERVTILSASDLPPGWTGKLWALNEGVSSSTASPAASQPPSFYWFTDADIAHAPDTLKNLVARAEQSNLDLTSLMVLLQSKTLPERTLIPAFLYFFLMLYPPGWIADEDLATAKAVKSSGGRVWMGLTRKSTSLRAYNTFGEIRDLIARTAYTQLRYSPLLLAGTLLGMLLTYAAPIVLLFAHDATARALGATAWLLMTLSFLPTVRFYRLSALWAPLLPLTALFYTYATWLSALRYWMGKGGQWKGRAQAQKT